MAKVRVKTDGNEPPKKTVVAAPPEKVIIPGHEDIPLYKPTDTHHIRLVDNRSVNPATGQLFSKDRMGAKTLNVSPSVLSTIVAHAKAKGIDPYDALAIPYQESGFGASGTGLGENKDYFPDKGIEDNFTDINEANMNKDVNAFVKGLADKFAYAKRLGYGNRGKEFMYQAYNGYGKLRPQPGEKTTAFYGIPVSHDNPLDMAKNPVYGKTVASLRNILVNNPDVKRIVENTPAFRSVWDAPPVEDAAPAKKVMVKVSK